VVEVTDRATISIEVFSDVVCPWCFIGKRRLAKALGTLADDPEFDADVEVVYRPFQLDPRAPLDRADPVLEVYARKFGGPDQAAAIVARTTAMAAAEGIEFHMDRAVRANTADAHRLLNWTLQHAGRDKQAEVKEALMTAYFCDGENVADHDVLVRRAEACGLDGGAVRTMLSEEAGLEDLEVGLQRAADLDVTAVPTYVVNGRWSIPGAQDPDTFVTALRRLATKLRDAS
jgi:predicted DsbA family dithiol-disulfide isomerase